MYLKCLAGAYAGQVRLYSMPVGLAALRAGTAARLDDTLAVRPAVTVAVLPAAQSDPSSKRAARKRERGQ